MARGIPINPDQLPRTQTNLGQFQKAEGLRGMNTDLSRSIASAGNTATIDPRGFIVAEQAVGNIGRAVAGEGGALMEMVNKQNEAINIRKGFEAETMMLEARNELSARLAKEPDETKWESVAEKQITSLRERLSKEELSQVAKDAIEMRAKRWEAEMRTNTTLASARESNSRAVGAIQDRLTIAREQQDLPTYTRILKDAVASRYLPKEKEELGMMEFEKRGQQLKKQAYQDIRDVNTERLAASMQADPWQTLQDLKENAPGDESRSAAYPDLDAQDRLRAIAEAEQQVRAVQADQLGGEGGIRDRIVTGDLDDKGIDDAVEALRLGAEEAQKLKNFRAQIADQKASNLPLDRKAVGALIGEIEAYQGDDKTDPIGAKWGELVQRAEVLTAAGGKEGDLTRGVLMQKIYQRHPGAERRTDKDMPEGMEKEFNAYLEAYRKDGAFGVPEYRVAPKMVASKDGITADPKEFVMEPNPAANARYVASQNRLWQELKSEYKAKPETVLAPGALEGWVKDRMKGFKAGAQVEKMRAAPTGPDAVLFPAIPDPTDLDNFLK